MNGDRNGCRHPRAFTLTEMLVVVGVLGILASLVSVSALAAKSKARSAQCSANLHQHGVALRSFLADHAEYPLTASFNATDRYPEHRRWWEGALFPEFLNPRGIFEGEPKIFDCPSAARPNEFPENLSYSDYGYNSWGLGGLVVKPLLGLGGKGPGPTMKDGLMIADYPPPVPESEVLNPSEMLSIGDGFNGWRGIVKDGLSVVGRGPDAQESRGSTARARSRHRGRANLLFCDGHVESLKLEFLFVEESDQALRIWNRDNQPHRERLTP